MTPQFNKLYRELLTEMPHVSIEPPEHPFKVFIDCCVENLPSKDFKSIKERCKEVIDYSVDDLIEHPLILQLLSQHNISKEEFKQNLLSSEG